MSVTVRIPTPLRKLTKDQPEVEVAGADIESIIENVIEEVLFGDSEWIAEPILKAKQKIEALNKK